MNFADSRWLYLIVPALAVFLGIRIIAAGRYQKRLALLSSQWKLASGRDTWEVARRGLILLSVALIGLALARPRWDFHWADVKHHGSDIVIVLDLSRSMLATDVKPNRLEKAKRSIRDLLSAVQGDRIGLVLFSGVAFIQCPLTFDKASFDLFLDQASVDLLPRQGTEIGAALELAEKAFEQGSEAGSRAKTVILISDGEDHGEGAFAKASALAEKGVRIFALAMGGEGSPIPAESGSFMRDANGQLIVSRPDIAGLSQIAQSGKGRLIAATEDLDRFYRQEMGHGDELQSTREKVWQERHMALSGLAFLLLTLEILLSRRKAF
ncbi:MAG: VWA domain-containing protein [Chitinophagaceae bacterium]|nr:VWA domain-containing protein [Oligoflexus sp.]